MRPRHQSIGIVTDDLLGCARFYARHFGFEIIYQADWYLHLRTPDAGLEIGLLLPEHPSQPPALRGKYNGAGAFINLQVADVDECYARMMAASEPIELALGDEPWGERHFLVRDPSGMVVNVFQKLTAHS